MIKCFWCECVMMVIVTTSIPTNVAFSVYKLTSTSQNNIDFDVNKIQDESVNEKKK